MLGKLKFHMFLASVKVHHISASTTDCTRTKAWHQTYFVLLLLLSLLYRRMQYRPGPENSRQHKRKWWDSNEIVGNKAKGRISKRVFQENFGVLCSLETPVLIFALLPYYRRVVVDFEATYWYHTIMCTVLQKMSLKVYLSV